MARGDWHVPRTHGDTSAGTRLVQLTRKPAWGYAMILRLLLIFLAAAPVPAGPYVAWVGNVPVHSPSPEAKIMVADLAGGAPVNVSAELHAARSPAWAPDASRIAFEAVGDGLCDIFFCKPDGSERVNLTSTPDEWESAPTFVANDRLAYLVGPDRTEIWLAELTTGARRKLSGAPRFYSRIAANARGSRLAVTGSDKLAGDGDVFLISVDGSQVDNLTKSPAIYSAPAFTPDGQTIVFAFDGCEIGGATRGVAAMPVAGGEPKLLAKNGYPFAPVSVSADGSRVAFTEASGYHSTWAALVGVDGADQTRLPVSPFHITAWPTFSPDGRSVAFQGVYAAVYRVNLLDLESKNLTRLTPGGETGVQPVFSPR